MISCRLRLVNRVRDRRDGGLLYVDMGPTGYNLDMAPRGKGPPLTRVQQNKQIGNAVNPDMASAIFRQIVLDAVLPVWLEMGRPAAEAFATRWRERYPV